MVSSSICVGNFLKPHSLHLLLWGKRAPGNEDRELVAEVVSPISLPSRPLTPEIDPPGPGLATWIERLFEPTWA